MTKIAVIYYSVWGHIRTLAEKAAEGAKEAGVEVGIFQIPETLSDEVLGKLHAAPKADHPVITPDELEKWDGYIFAIPTRYGRAVAQFSAFFDRTGGQWATQSLSKKFATIVSSTGTQHGGQETTALTTVPYLVHQGIIFVPLGYATPDLLNMTEIMAGSPYGAATLAKDDGSRQPSELELKITSFHGKYFADIVDTYVSGKAAKVKPEATTINTATEPAATATTAEPEKQVLDPTTSAAVAEPQKTEESTTATATGATGKAASELSAAPGTSTTTDNEAGNASGSESKKKGWKKRLSIFGSSKSKEASK